MTRLEAALAELAAAIREEVAAEAPAAAPLTYTVEQAAKRIGVGRTFCYREINAGHLRAARRGRRLIVTEAAIAAYLEAGS